MVNGKNEFWKKQPYNAKPENNQDIDVIFIGEKLFLTNKEVIWSKLFYTNMAFKIQVPTSDIIFLLIQFPLIAPVIANTSLYQTVSILPDKRE